MKVFTEKRAEEFLEGCGFKVVDRVYLREKEDIKKVLKKIDFPWVMKVCGRKIIHKNRLRGVKKNIKNHKQALRTFEKLKKIKNSEGVIIQKQVKGREFLLGIKNTPEFEHVIGLGAGGIYAEKIKDISFRVCPIEDLDINQMIKEIKATKRLSKKGINLLKENLKKLCILVKKYPKIKELDINPLMVFDKDAVLSLIHI